MCVFVVCSTGFGFGLCQGEVAEVFFEEVEEGQAREEEQAQQAQEEVTDHVAPCSGGKLGVQSVYAWKKRGRAARLSCLAVHFASEANKKTKMSSARARNGWREAKSTCGEETERGVIAPL